MPDALGWTWKLLGPFFGASWSCGNALGASLGGPGGPRGRYENPTNDKKDESPRLFDFKRGEFLLKSQKDKRRLNQGGP